MQQQPIHGAISTAALIRSVDNPASEEKMSVHDLVVVVEQVALALGVCGLVHLVM